MPFDPYAVARALATAFHSAADGRATLAEDAVGGGVVTPLADDPALVTSSPSSAPPGRWVDRSLLLGPVVPVVLDQSVQADALDRGPAIVISDPSCLRRTAQYSTAARTRSTTGSPKRLRTKSSSPKALRRYSGAVVGSRNGCDR
jgi:hypothetical protein